MLISNVWQASCNHPRYFPLHLRYCKVFFNTNIFQSIFFYDLLMFRYRLLLKFLYKVLTYMNLFLHLEVLTIQN